MRAAVVDAVVAAPAEWQPAYVGLGSNLGDSRASIGRAIEAIAALDGTRLLARSAHYRSVPYGPVAQDPFVNAAVGVLTRLPPLDLLRALRAIELQLGRHAGRVRWGPREIDLDLLVYGDLCISTDELVLPHPGIPERDFVLYPLLDIAPALHVPGLGMVAGLAAAVTNRGIERLD